MGLEQIIDEEPAILRQRESEPWVIGPPSVGIFKIDRGYLLGLVIATVLLRAVVFIGISWRLHLTVGQFGHLYDGGSYLVTAQAMLGDTSQFNDYHGRVFPGFPAMIALLHRAGVPWAVGAIGLDWVCAAVAAALAAVVFQDRRIGWGMAMGFPHYLMNSTMAMSEAPLLAFTLSGLLLSERRRPLLGGIALGLAGLVRPMACFAVIGAVLVALRRKRYRDVMALMVTSGAIVLIGLALMNHWRGDALAGARYYATGVGAYNGHLFAWPFESLALTPFREHISWPRVAYLWGHALIALMACFALIRRYMAGPEDRDALCVPWLLGNTAFSLCVGSIWGFECFHRFLIPALPALLWPLRTFLPRRAVVWIGVAAICATVAILSAQKVLMAN